MKREFIRCEYCSRELPSERCEFAVHLTVIDGKEFLFCCAKCATRFKQKTAKSKAKKPRSNQ